MSSPDIHEIARQQAVLVQRVDDHDNVLVDIREHLATVATELGKLKLWGVGASALFFAGSETGHALLLKLIG